MNRKERRGAKKKSRAGSKSVSGVAQSIARAIEMIQAGNLEEGEALLIAARRKDPNNVEAKHHLGMIMARTGRADAGIALLREVVAATPREALYWNNLAASCLAVQRSAEAVEAAKEATLIDPGYAMAWENLGFAYRDLKQPSEAVGAFAAAARLQDLDGSTRRVWASCLLELGRYNEAEGQAREALASQAQDAEALTTLGLAMMQQSRDDEALTTLKQSLDLNADNLIAAISYGRLLMRRADGRDVALRWLRRATSIAPRSAATWRVLADALFRSGLQEEAAAAIARAAQLAPADPGIADLQKRIGAGDKAGAASGSVPSLDEIVVSVSSTETPGPAAKSPPAAQPENAPRVLGNGANPVFDLSILKIGE